MSSARTRAVPTIIRLTLIGFLLAACSASGLQSGKTAGAAGSSMGGGPAGGAPGLGGAGDRGGASGGTGGTRGGAGGIDAGPPSGAGGGTTACKPLGAIPRRLWRLSAEQWGNAVQSLLNLPSPPALISRGGEATYAFFSDATLGVDDSMLYAIYNAPRRRDDPD